MAEIITVSALNQYVKTVLEHDEVLGGIGIRGEISNFVNHFKTGHLYFSLKDGQCAVKGVMFRQDAAHLAFAPQNGMNVIVRGRVSLFERDGAFQIYVQDMFPDGVGAIQLAFERLKETLEQEGLFRPERKKPIPAMPKKIGLITSKTGAAIQDIFSVSQRRNPLAEFVVLPVTVQGNAAGAALAAAVKALDEAKLVDVIIIARGGGSKEDLWVFNDERLARAVYAASTPIVSAVGHEIDFTILDFVADLRAPTPSAAAELVVPDMQAILRANANIFANIRKEIQKRMNLCYTILARHTSAPAFKRAHNLPFAQAQALLARQKQLSLCMHQKLQTGQKSLQNHAALCETLSPYAVLKRGYAIAKTPSGAAVRSVKNIKKGDSITVILQDGALGCKIDTLEDRGAL